MLSTLKTNAINAKNNFFRILSSLKKNRMIKLGQPKCPKAWFDDQSHMSSCYVNEI